MFWGKIEGEFFFYLFKTQLNFIFVGVNSDYYIVQGINFKQ